MKSSLVLVAIIILSGLIFGSYIFSQKSSVSPIDPSPIASPQITTPSPSPTVELPTKYILAVDWPPRVTTENNTFSCVEAGTSSERAGQTEKLTINNHIYCVTKVSEGAAGSIYTQYAYARSKNNQTEIFTFNLRFVQCGNYPEVEKRACETEREAFNIDNFIDQYIQTK